LERVLSCISFAVTNTKRKKTSFKLSLFFASPPKLSPNNLFVT